MVRPGRGIGFGAGFCEHRLEMARYRLPMRIQLREEGLPGIETRHLRDPRAVLRIGGQLVRLCIVEILQAVLDIAQEDIGGGKFFGRAAGQQIFLRKLLQHFKRRPHRQRRIAAAANQLQRLGDEFDLADAARPELDVPGELAPRDLAPHFGMQPAHCREGRVVEVLAVDERPHDGVKFAVPAARNARRRS